MNDWKTRAAEKREAILQAIPQEWRLSPSDITQAKTQKCIAGQYAEQYLRESTLLILKQNPMSLVESLQSGAYSASQVTRAFCEAAAVAHQLTGCLHEIFFDQALERASELDDYYRTHKKPIGRLHGLPISLKDQFHVKGVDTTIGYVGWIGTFEGDPASDQIRKVSSQTVDDLLSLGAIVYCKTSVPQTLEPAMNENNIVGAVMNPFNQQLATGGSSGGEAVLLALRGSVVGLGTDRGGSVRWPAGMNDIYALKPSVGRLSMRNMACPTPGAPTIPGTVGVMAVCMELVGLLLEALVDTKPWLRDMYLHPLPWRQNIVEETLARAEVTGAAKAGKRLKIAAMWGDGLVTPHPPITRVMQSVVEALENAGHKVVDCHGPALSTARNIVVTQFRADGGHDHYKQLRLSGEPLIPDMVNMLKRFNPISTTELFDSVVEARKYCYAVAEYWDSLSCDDNQPVDAIIAPVSPYASMVSGEYDHEILTSVFNLLDYSAAAIPVGIADKAVDVKKPDFQPLSEHDACEWAKYSPEMHDGVPVGIQLVGKRLEEEKVYAMARIVDKVIAQAGIRRV